MKKVNKKVWYAIGVLVVILIAWSMLRGGKKEEKVSFETWYDRTCDIGHRRYAGVGYRIETLCRL